MCAPTHEHTQHAGHSTAHCCHAPLVMMFGVPSTACRLRRARLGTLSPCAMGSYTIQCMVAATTVFHRSDQNAPKLGLWGVGKGLTRRGFVGVPTCSSTLHAEPG